MVVERIHGDAVYEDAILLVRRERSGHLRQRKGRSRLPRMPEVWLDAARRVEEDDLGHGRDGAGRGPASMHREHLCEGRSQGRAGEALEDPPASDRLHRCTMSAERRVTKESCKATCTKSSGISRSRARKSALSFWTAPVSAPYETKPRANR